MNRCAHCNELVGLGEWHECRKRKVKKEGLKKALVDVVAASEALDKVIENNHAITDVHDLIRLFIKTNGCPRS